MMPRITKVWTHAQSPNRIHYMIVVGDDERHLYTQRDSALGRMLVQVMK